MSGVREIERERKREAKFSRRCGNAVKSSTRIPHSQYPIRLRTARLFACKRNILTIAGETAGGGGGVTRYSFRKMIESPR